MDTDFEPIAQGPGWYDIAVKGELYRYYEHPRDHYEDTVIGPDNTDYTSEFWCDEWGISLSDIKEAFRV